ncbi:YciI family protein [Roseateles sp.]|uniref:YciI family protein n=1 Tax=Roseateles sp. TaxID=1971397 RepID=UPI002E0ABA1F|nr:YciI family protein [Roseateles sp.]
MKYYLCKFIPPRGNFHSTLTPDEREVMEEHGHFLDYLLQKGLIVAHGDLMNEATGYGVTLYEIADDQDIEALTSQDPVISSGVGKFEVFPMLNLATRRR